MDKLYNEDEIKEFKTKLENAAGNKKEIESVLSYDNTRLLKSYLLKIGMNPIFTGDIGIIETIRLKLQNRLSYDKVQCELTDTEIRAFGGGFKETKMHADKDGGFYLSDTEYIKGPDINGNVYIIDSNPALHTTTKIGKYGNIESEFSNGGPGMSNEYSSFERIYEDNLPKVISEASDGASWGYHKETLDFGNPMNPENREKSFKENYELFTEEYPKLKIWYDKYFDRDEKSIEEYSDYLIQTQEEQEISELEQEISRYMNYLNEEKDIKTENYANLGRMIEYIKDFKKKSIVGKKVADKVLNNLKEIKKPELKAIPEEIEEKEEETNAEKKARLESRLKRLQVERINTGKEERYIDQLIRTTKIELRKIPLVGKKITQKACEYENDNTGYGKKVSFDDDEPVV